MDDAHFRKYIGRWGFDQSKEPRHLTQEERIVRNQVFADIKAENRRQKIKEGKDAKILTKSQIIEQQLKEQEKAEEEYYLGDK